MSRGKLEFAQTLLFLNGRPMQFGRRPYLPAIYDSRTNLILRASRQVEKSTFLTVSIAYEAVKNPGITILLICPRLDQARVFFHDRLERLLQESPLIRRHLLSGTGHRLQFTHTRFSNGSTLFVRAAFHSADSARGISADLLLVDEFQDIAPGNLPVLQETLSHSQIRRTILTGTPKLCDNHLEEMYQQSTANEWMIDCQGCHRGVVLDERTLGPSGIVCPACQRPLDVSTGKWVPRNPQAVSGDGFWINHLMVPWINYDEVLERQRIYDLGKFKNEVLGLSTNLGEHAVTRGELEACCTDLTMTNSAEEIPDWARPYVAAGIDWGGGGISRTVMAIGYMRDDFVFQICHISRFHANEDPGHVLDCCAQLCRRFRVHWIAADGGGNGHINNRLLLDRLHYSPNYLYAIFYSMSDLEPRQDGSLWKWTVHRSATIGALFTRVKKRTILFPRATECGTYLDEFACEFAEYDDINRVVKYSHPDNQPDDALHAVNYCLLLGIRLFYSKQAQPW